MGDELGYGLWFLMTRALQIAFCSRKSRLLDTGVPYWPQQLLLLEEKYANISWDLNHSGFYIPRDRDRAGDYRGAAEVFTKDSVEIIGTIV